MKEIVPCPICQGPSREAFRAVVLKAYEGVYRHCPICEFVFAHQPLWLAQAYASPIVAADTGLVARNLAIADKLTAVLCAFFNSHGRFVDLAGGTGLLVRLMRDRGFNFYWEDRFCSNLHAAGFEAPSGGVDFEAATAFEVLEHTEDPLVFLADALARTRTRTVIFSTLLHNGSPPPLDWWYYAFNTGQHIAFFSHETLQRIALKLGCRLVSASGVHMLTAQALSERNYRWAVRYLRTYYRLWSRLRLTSRTDSDHRAILAGTHKSL